MLPVGAFAGTFCAQTHASYAGLVGGMAAFTVVVVAVKAYRSRGDRVTLSRIGSWCAVAAGVAVVMWLPPLVEQFTSTRGNLSIIADDFLHPPFRPIGAGAGIAALLRRMNLFRAFDGLSPGTGPSGSMAPGAALVAAWALSAVVAWRRREQRLNRLNAVIAVALVLAAYSASRIYGFVWFYLLLYGWSLAAAALFATAGRRGGPSRCGRGGGAAFSTATVAVRRPLSRIHGVSRGGPPTRAAERHGEQSLGRGRGPTTKAPATDARIRSTATVRGDLDRHRGARRPGLGARQRVGACGIPVGCPHPLTGAGPTTAPCPPAPSGRWSTSPPAGRSTRGATSRRPARSRTPTRATPRSGPRPAGCTPTRPGGSGGAAGPTWSRASTPSSSWSRWLPACRPASGATPSG